MNGYKTPNPEHPHSSKRCVWLLSLSALLVTLLAAWPIPSTASLYFQNGSHIVLPANGKVVVNFVNTDTACTGDFGLYSPQQVLIYPDYLYYKGVPFPLPGYYTENTELVFYIIPRGVVCPGNTYLSTDPNRARITHPTANTWVIAWEDWNDGDFNDLIVQINFQPGITPFLDLPYDYTGSTFFNESRDTEQGGKVNAYFDHQYPTYCSPPNIGGCSSSDTRAVNFYGYDGTQTKPAPPYRVLYNGHDGIDYLIPQETPVLAADSGTIIFAGGISSVCKDGQTRTANVIKVQHSNGYVTEYWHLSSFAPGISVGATVSRDPSHPIGYVGSTGCSDGPHLHFLVRNPSGIVVDPYGWMPLPDAAWYGQTDPWQQYNTDNGGADATSHYLWVHELITTTLLSRSEPTIITSTSTSVVAIFPAGAYNAPLRIQVAEGLQSALVPGHRSLYSFSLFGYTTNDVPVTTLANEITLNIHIPTGKLQASSISSVVTPTLQVWDAQDSTWEELPTSWDPLTNSARATTSKIGAFALTIPEHRIYLPLVSKSAP